MNYKDKETLRRLYWDEQLSQSQVGSRLGVSTSCIGLWMKKLGVPTRTQAMATHLGNANHVDLTQSLIEFIDGSLLGDGSVTMNKSISAMFQQVSKHKHYLEWIRNYLKSLGIEFTRRIIPREHTYKSRRYFSYQLCSRSYSQLATFRERWYSTGKKHPPRDLKMTPIMLRQWLMDDGHFRSRPEVRLTNFSFSKSDKKFLGDLLLEHGIKSTISKSGLRIRNVSIKTFFEFIGSCPVPQIYGYKWPIEEPSKQMDLF